MQYARHGGWNTEPDESRGLTGPWSYLKKSDLVYGVRTSFTNCLLLPTTSHAR